MPLITPPDIVATRQDFLGHAAFFLAPTHDQGG